MEFLYPWGNFFSRLGGTIDGNVHITGTLQVDGLTTMYDCLTISLDAGLWDPSHIVLKKQTNAGAVESIRCMDEASNLLGIFGFDGVGNSCFACAPGAYHIFPVDYTLAEATLAIDGKPNFKKLRQHIQVQNLIFGSL